MQQPYLFLSGESGLTLKLVFRTDNWSHTCSPTRLVSVCDGVIRRHQYPREELKGVIFYADMDDKVMESLALRQIIASGVPCWPDPNVLMSMINRHDVMACCVHKGFIDHKVLVVDWFNQDREAIIADLPQFPLVVKMGTSHRGAGKFLVHSREELEALPFDMGQLCCDITIEPFFVGRSVRALIVGDRTFGLQIDNETSWIKNTCGAEVSDITLPDELVQHARLVAGHFCLDVSGVDYIIDDDEGKFHFLEINQFPGVSGMSEDDTDYIEKYLRSKMDWVEKQNNE